MIYRKRCVLLRRDRRDESIEAERYNKKTLWKYWQEVTKSGTETVQLKKKRQNT